MKILQIDLDQGEVKEEKLAAEFKTSGGRLLTLSFLLDLPGDLDPLSSEAPLIFATGPLAGSGVTCSHRLSAGGKSPLTGGIKESNSGGMVAYHLARLGYRALLIKGANQDGDMVIRVEPEKVHLERREKYRELGNYDLLEEIRKEYGADYSVISIGPAGENGLLSSGIAITDPLGLPNRFAARGGLGAVMGSKGVKAILISAKGKQRFEPQSKGEFQSAQKEFNRIVRENPRIEVLQKYGTASTVSMVNQLGALPTRNFSQGTFAGAEKIDGEHMYKLITQRGGGTPTESCMPGCIIQCSNVFPGPDGKRIVGPIEYETLGLLGSNLDIDCLDTIAHLNYLCNDLGLDTIEVGCSLGVATEAGLVSYGDGKTYGELIEEMGKNTVLWRVLGQGAFLAGQVLGVKRVPVAKRQGISAYDPRGVKGTGVTYATSPMGADHTAGLTVFAPVEHGKKDGQLELSRKMQLVRAAYDALGLCAFLLGATGPHPDKAVALINAAYGKEHGADYLEKLGAQVIAGELKFNEKAGFRPANDCLPEFFYKEKLPPYDLTFDLSREETGSLFEDLRKDS